MKLTWLQRSQMFVKLSPIGAEVQSDVQPNSTFLPSCAETPPDRALAIIRKQNGNHWHLNTLATCTSARALKGEAVSTEQANFKRAPVTLRVVVHVRHRIVTTILRLAVNSVGCN